MILSLLCHDYDDFDKKIREGQDIGIALKESLIPHDESESLNELEKLKKTPFETLTMLRGIPLSGGNSKTRKRSRKKPRKTAHHRRRTFRV